MMQHLQFATKVLFFILLIPTFSHSMSHRAIRSKTWHVPNIYRENTQTRELHHDKIKNLLNDVKPEYQHLSPVNGASLVRSGWLSNFYTLGNRKHATHQLVSDSKTGLFYKNPIDGRFAPVNNKSLPGYSLSAQIIGDILGTLEKKEFSNNSVKKDIAQQWFHTHKEITGDKITHAKIIKTLDTIEQSNDEYSSGNTNRLYLPGTTQAILTGYLFAKSHDRKPILDYFKSLNKHVPILKQEMIDEEAWISDAYTNTDLKAYLAELLEAKKTESSIGSSNLHALISKDIEKTVHHLLSELENPVTPPAVTQGSYAFTNNTEPRPDCMETTMRGFFYWLLANGNDKRADLTQLPKNISPRQEFVDYFTKYADFKTINNNRASGQDWMDLVSGHDFLRYKLQSGYDLNPRVSNFLKLTNYLLNTNAANVEELGKLLSTHGRIVSIKLENELNDATDNQNNIHMMIGKHHLIAKIQPGHGHLVIPKPSQEYGTYGNEPYKQSMRFGRNDSDSTGLPVLPLFVNKLTSAPVIDKKTTVDRMHHLYFSLQQEPNILVDNLVKIMPHAAGSSELQSLVINGIATLPNDQHFHTTLAESIVRNRAYKNCPELIQYTYGNNPALTSVETITAVRKSCLNEFLKLAKNIPTNEQNIHNDIYIHIKRIIEYDPDILAYEQLFKILRLNYHQFIIEILRTVGETSQSKRLFRDVMEDYLMRDDYRKHGTWGEGDEGVDTYFDRVRMFLEAGIDVKTIRIPYINVSVVIRDELLLICAIKHNAAELVELLLQYNAEVNESHFECFKKMCDIPTFTNYELNNKARILKLLLQTNFAQKNPNIIIPIVSLDKVRQISDCAVEFLNLHGIQISTWEKLKLKTSFINRLWHGPQ